MVGSDPESLLGDTVRDEPLLRGAQIRVLEETASTQDDARALAQCGLPVIVLARLQTRGRGRRGRTWYEAPGRGLALSVAFDASFLPADELSPRIGAAVFEAISGLVPEDRLALKWPNDVVDAPSARKLAGVLIETSGATCVAGVGVNVLHAPADLPPDIRESACSIAMLGGAGDVLDCACAILRAMGPALRGPWHAIAATWQQRNWLAGKTVRIACPEGVAEGTVQSLDPLGLMTLRSANRTIARDVRTIREVRVLDHTGPADSP